MRHRLVLLVVLPILLLPSVALAQSGAPVDLPPVTLPIAVTTVVSIVIGVLNMIAQGSILNLFPTPKPWVAPASLALTFLTGVSSFLGTAAQPWTGSTVFYAFAFGLFGLVGGGLPALIVHGHVTLPRAMRAAKLLPKAA